MPNILNVTPQPTEAEAIGGALLKILTQAGTTTPVTGTTISAALPEFVTLPFRGGDPVCGMSRSWWLAQEKAGRIRMTRLRLPGRTKGRVLLPVAAALACINKIAADGAKAV